MNIPSSVVYIDTAAFHECWELTKLTLPAGLTHIGEAAFFQCRNIDTLVSLAPEPPVAFANTFTQMNSNLTLIVPCHSDSLYAAAPYCAGIDGIEEDAINIYTLGDRIIVEGAEGESVRIYDITGRSVRNEALPTGVYIVKVGDRPARKVVVMK